MTPRKVDPYVYVMEWIWRHSKTKGVMQHVLLRIGRAMRWTPSGFETGPLPTVEIAKDTGLGDSTVREQVGKLAARNGVLEVFRGSRRGETYRYRLKREQELPLEDIEPATHRQLAAVTPPARSGQSPPVGSGHTASTQRSQRHDPAVSALPVGGDAPDVSISSEGVRTEDHDDDDVTRDVTSVYGWWLVEFPAARGVPADVTLDEFDPPARELLALGYTVADLQAMALLMWSVRDLAVHDWIPTTNYSIRVLRRTATWLAQRVREQASRVREPWVCPHVDPCAHRAMCDHKNHMPHKYPRRPQEAAG